MRQIKKLLTMAFMLYLTISAIGQQIPTGYNPFVPANLDDPAKVTEVPVVESSYHYYTINGDPNYTGLSTYVWYVENGTMGTYDPILDVWTPAGSTSAISNGVFTELLGVAGSGNSSSSGIWVRWNDGSGGNTGYIAAYERSADQCIFDQQISGFKHNILVPPEIWFLVDVREECSDQIYSVSAQLNELHPNSFPYRLSYSYPENNGIINQVDTLIYQADLTASNLFTWDITAVQDLDVALDENYTISIDSFRDNFGSDGKIAPLGPIVGQHPSINITILHLPQTGGMNMN